MLVVTGNQNRETLVKRLEKEGRAIVDTLPLYKTTKTDLSADPVAERFRAEGADAVLFTSSSTVKSFVDQQKRHCNSRTAPLSSLPSAASAGAARSTSVEANRLPWSLRDLAHGHRL